MPEMSKTEKVWVARLKRLYPNYFKPQYKHEALDRLVRKGIVERVGGVVRLQEKYGLGNLPE